MYDKCFIDACLYGDADLEDIDAYVAYWHNNDTNNSLEEFLGMTEYEYETWMKNDDSIIRDILRCRMDGIPFDKYLLMSDSDKIAARSWNIDDIESMKNDDKHGDK